MKKSLGFIILLSLFFVLSPVSAKQAPEDDITEAVEGTFDVPGRPDMKVRVFVHREKAKPGPGPTVTAPTCGLLDPESTATTGDAGWRLPSTFTYRLNPSSVPSSIGGTNLPTIADSGFDAWTNALAAEGTVLTLTRGSDTLVSRATFDGQNIVAWGRTSGSALGVTYIWYNNVTHIAAEVDTVMNKKFNWSWTNQATSPGCAVSNTYDAQNILTHEIGHWFGMDDEYTAATHANNTMYGYGSKSEIKKNTLTTGDIAGIQGMYP